MIIRPILSGGKGRFLLSPSLLHGRKKRGSDTRRSELLHDCQIQNRRRRFYPAPEFNVISRRRVSNRAFVIRRFEIKHVFDIEDVADIESPNSHESERSSSEQEGIDFSPLTYRIDRRAKFDSFDPFKQLNDQHLADSIRKLVARSRIILDYPKLRQQHGQHRNPN